MPLISKTFPSPYGGISEQSVELMLDTQCVDMVNCVPDVVLGTQRRNGLQYKASGVSGTASSVFHFYDRGEGDERYFMRLTGVPSNPLEILDINGVSKTVAYSSASTINTYLGSDKSKLKALTIQDRTFILNRAKKIDMTIVDTPDILYDRPAYYWLSRSSNDVNNKYNYAVYLDGTTFQYASEKSDAAATALAGLITAGGGGFVATASGSVIKITKTGYGTTGTGGGLRVPYDTDHKYVAVRPTAGGTTEYVDVTLCDTTITPVEQTLCYKMTVQNYYIENVIGGVTTWKTFAELAPLSSTIDFKYYKKQGSNYIDPQVRTLDVIFNTNGAFTFSYWDSWGSQASFGWQGTVQKLSDLPSEIGFSNVIVNITGNDSDSFTDYYVRYDGSTWVETRNPEDNRGTFTNMPIYVDRLEDGTFYVSTLTWEVPHIGSLLTNPTPSFVGHYITDIFFYKNRLGFASGSSIALSETGGYYNFYSKTVLEVLDDDPIDVSIPSGEATNIYYAVSFQAGLFAFTKDAQYVLKQSSDNFSPNTVSFDLISKLPIDTDVEPINASNSLFFVSRTGTIASQLREYKYNNDTLIADGINLSVQTPNLLPDISKIAVDVNLGYVFMFSTTTPDTLYCYKYLQQGDERVQSAFFKWTFSFNIINFFCNRSSLYIFKSGDYLLYMDLLVNNNTKVDYITNISTVAYDSYFVLPRWNIRVTKMETPVDTIIVKRLTFVGEGTYNVDIYRKDYGTTTSRTYDSNSTVDGTASVLAKNKNVVITLRNNGDANFRLDSMILDGLYTQIARETN